MTICRGWLEDGKLMILNETSLNDQILCWERRKMHMESVLCMRKDLGDRVGDSGLVGLMGSGVILIASHRRS